MSKNRNRCKLLKAISSKEYDCIWSNINYPDYWDDGLIYYHNNYHNGSKCPNKSILSYQYRMYRTWKHNRQTQYKIKKSW